MMKSYEDIQKFAEGKTLPIIGKNEENELVIIEQDTLGDEKYFQVITVQHNDWRRVNVYWKNGTIEQTYIK